MGTLTFGVFFIFIHAIVQSASGEKMNYTAEAQRARRKKNKIFFGILMHKNQVSRRRIYLF